MYSTECTGCHVNINYSVITYRKHYQMHPLYNEDLFQKICAL